MGAAVWALLWFQGFVRFVEPKALVATLATLDARPSREYSEAMECCLVAEPPSEEVCERDLSGIVPPRGAGGAIHGCPEERLHPALKLLRASAASLKGDQPNKLK
jgi:hypothetical protein